MAKKRKRKSVDATPIDAREKLILGKPPRILPQTSERAIKEAMDLTVRLRKAALPDAPSIPVSQMPEIMTTLTCHSALWERLAMVSVELLGNGALDRRDAELAILRISWLCQAPYEWGEHIGQAKRAGVTPKEIERLIVGSSAKGWGARDRAILSAAEELHEEAMVSDKTWKTLAKHFDDKQLFELLVLIGQFTMVAYFQNSLRLRLYAGNIGLKAR